MNCHDAENFIMKYMDGDITKKEAEGLHDHLSDCPLCKCSFEIYDAMLQEFDKMPLMQVPEDFESQVMAKITQLSDNKFHVQYSIRNRVWGHIWGAFTIIFGTGTIIALNYEPIMQSLSRYPAFEGFIHNLAPVKGEIAEQTQTLQVVTENVFVVANQTLTNSVGIILTILTAVCGVQYYLLRRKKKTDRINHR